MDDTNLELVHVGLKPITTGEELTGKMHVTFLKYESTGPQTYLTFVLSEEDTLTTLQDLNRDMTSWLQKQNPKAAELMTGSTVS